MDWSVSNVTFYVCLFVAAVVMAIDQAIKDSSDIRAWKERVFHSSRWSYLRYAPLVLLFAAGGIQLHNAIRIGEREQEPTNRPTVSPSEIAMPVEAPTVRISPKIDHPMSTPSIAPSPPAFTDVTPADLASIVREHTSAQTQKLVQPYIGKMMKVSGVVMNVFGPEPLLGSEGPLVVFRTPKSHYLVLMQFSKEQTERVASLNEGDPITVTGRISEVSLMALNLNNCTFELVRNRTRLSQ